jgi:hypothetical protein
MAGLRPGWPAIRKECSLTGKWLLMPFRMIIPPVVEEVDQCDPDGWNDFG